MTLSVPIPLGPIMEAADNTAKPLSELNLLSQLASAPPQRSVPPLLILDIERTWDAIYAVARTRQTSEEGLKE
jgi:hypothetical protein